MKIFVATVSLFFCLALGFGRASADFHLEASALYGVRSVADSEIKRVYGDGYVYFPYAALEWKGVFLGAGYEGGYSRSGKIGLFEEPSSFEIHGFELFVGYVFRMKIIAPYVKIGCGSYSYKQTIESPYIGNYKVDNKKAAVMVGGGLRIYALKNLFFVGEGKYIPLKVKPFEQKVDLSGFRLSAGIGLTL